MFLRINIHIYIPYFHKKNQVKYKNIQEREKKKFRILKLIIYIMMVSNIYVSSLKNNHKFAFCKFSGSNVDINNVVMVLPPKKLSLF